MYEQKILYSISQPFWRIYHDIVKRRKQQKKALRHTLTYSVLEMNFKLVNRKNSRILQINYSYKIINTT